MQAIAEPRTMQCPTVGSVPLTHARPARPSALFVRRLQAQSQCHPVHRSSDFNGLVADFNVAIYVAIGFNRWPASLRSYRTPQHVSLLPAIPMECRGSTWSQRGALGRVQAGGPGGGQLQPAGVHSGLGQRRTGGAGRRGVRRLRGSCRRRTASPGGHGTVQGQGSRCTPGRVTTGWAVHSSGFRPWSSGSCDL